MCVHLFAFKAARGKGVDGAVSRRLCTPTLISALFALGFSKLRHALFSKSYLGSIVADLLVGPTYGLRLAGRPEGKDVISAVSAESIPSSAPMGSIFGGMNVVDTIDDGEDYDVVVVGGGAAGVAAGMRAAAAGLRTLVIEAGMPVGWADARPATDASADIPHLESLGPARPQASPGRLLVNSEVVSMVASSRGHQLRTAHGQSVRARALIVATGSERLRTAVPNSARFENHGVHYAATGMEAALCVEEDVMIVGDTEDAGQVAVFLGGVARQVHILVHSEGMLAGLSSYLAERIQGSPNISLHPFREILDLGGATALETVTWQDAAGVEQTCNIRNLFVMAGAVPRTRWLCNQLDLDAGGFVRTDLRASGAGYRFEASCAGVFAVGDVRSGSVKGAAVALEEGSAVVADIQRYLVTLDRDDG